MTLHAERVECCVALAVWLAMAADSHAQLRDRLFAFTPRMSSERIDLDRIMSRVNAGAAWDRTTPLHITASALIVHPPTRRVLLRWHERQHAWLQVGGHGDPGEDDPIAVALREGAEETGLGDLRPWPSAELQHVVIVPVPANDREPAHHHADLRCFLSTDSPHNVRPENATAKLRWLSPIDAAELTTEDNVRETIRRAARFLETQL